MPGSLLYNLQTQKPEWVSEADLPAALASSTYRTYSGSSVTRISTGGEVEASELPAVSAAGVQTTSVPSAQLASDARRAAAVAAHDNLGDEILTAIDGAVQTASVGLLDGTGIGGEKQQQLREEANPYAHAGGALITALASMRAPVGLASPVADAAFVAGEKVTGALARRQVLAQAAGLGTAGAIEGLAYSAGAQVNNALTGDPVSGEAILNGITLGGAIGGIAGGIGARASKFVGEIDDAKRELEAVTGLTGDAGRDVYRAAAEPARIYGQALVYNKDRLSMLEDLVKRGAMGDPDFDVGVFLQPRKDALAMAERAGRQAMRAVGASKLDDIPARVDHILRNGTVKEAQKAIQAVFVDYGNAVQSLDDLMRPGQAEWRRLLDLDVEFAGKVPQPADEVLGMVETSGEALTKGGPAQQAATRAGKVVQPKFDGFSVAKYAEENGISFEEAAKLLSSDDIRDAARAKGIRPKDVDAPAATNTDMFPRVSQYDIPGVDAAAREVSGERAAAMANSEQRFNAALIDEAAFNRGPNAPRRDAAIDDMLAKVKGQLDINANMDAEALLQAKGRLGGEIPGPSGGTPLSKPRARDLNIARDLVVKGMSREAHGMPLWVWNRARAEVDNLPIPQRATDDNEWWFGIKGPGGQDMLVPRSVIGGKFTDEAFLANLEASGQYSFNRSATKALPKAEAAGDMAYMPGPKSRTVESTPQFARGGPLSDGQRPAYLDALDFWQGLNRESKMALSPKISDQLDNALNQLEAASKGRLASPALRAFAEEAGMDVSRIAGPTAERALSLWALKKLGQAAAEATVTQTGKSMWKSIGRSALAGLAGFKAYKAAGGKVGGAVVGGVVRKGVGEVFDRVFSAQGNIARMAGSVRLKANRAVSRVLSTRNVTGLTHALPAVTAAYNPGDVPTRSFARKAEQLRKAMGSPEAVREQIRRNLDEVRAVDPMAADRAEELAFNRIKRLAVRLPNFMARSMLGQPAPPTSDLVSEWETYEAIVQDPDVAMELVLQGRVDDVVIQALEENHPEYLNEVVKEVMADPDRLRRAPLQVQVAMSKLLGANLVPEADPFYLQRQQLEYDEEAQAAASKKAQQQASSGGMSLNQMPMVVPLPGQVMAMGNTGNQR